MAFVNLPPNLQDIFNGIYDRLAKLETGPSQPLYVAESAQATADSAQGSAASASAQATTALIDAAAAQAAAATAYAVASTAIQVSANTIVNASNQLTSINGNGVTIYSGASSSSGARVILNSAGLAAYNSSNTATLTIDSSTGSISMLGSLTAGSNISGATITGGVVQTSTGTTSVAMVGTENGIGFKDSGAYSGWISSIGTAGIVLNYGASPSAGAYPQSRITSGAATVTGSAGTGFSANSNGTNGISGATNVFDSITMRNLMYAQSTCYYAGASTASGSTLVLVSTGSRIGYISSSRTTKKNIEELVPGHYLDVINSLTPVSFDWKEQPEDMPYRRNFGLIAEDTALIPEVESVVNFDAEGNAVTISYDRLTPFLVMTTKELNAKIQSLEARISALENGA